MVIQFLGHRDDGCLDWFDTTECSTIPTPTPITTCPEICNGEGGTPCWNGLLWVRMNWSSDAECNGYPLIGGPLDLYFVYGGPGTWLYSTPVAGGVISCAGGEWSFTFQNSAGGLWSVEGVLGNVANMQNPCNIVGLSGTGTIIWNLLNGCSGQSTANLSVEAYPCPE